MNRPRVLPCSAAVASLLAATLAILLSLGCKTNGPLIRPAVPEPLPPGTPGTWQDLGLTTGFVEVEALTTWNGSLIAGGFFPREAGQEANGIARWVK